jgi:tetratricopeptide (TPR) repeat protein
MPRKGVAGIPHSDDTNHRIVRRPGQPYPDYAFEGSDPDLPGLVCINRRGEDATQPIPPLIKLLAYNEVMLSKRLPEATRYFLELLEQLKTSAPDEPVVLAFLGRKAMAGQDYDKAVQYLTRAIERGADYDTTYLDLGEALSKMGRVEGSAEVLERGVATWPFSADLQQALVLRYMALDRIPQMLDALRRYLRLFPEDAIAREALAGAEDRNP